MKNKHEPELLGDVLARIQPMRCPRCNETCWRDEGPEYGVGNWRCTPCQWEEGDDPDPPTCDECGAVLSASIDREQCVRREPLKSASAIRRRVADRLFPGSGCTDAGCVFGAHDGMHTNGGCECLMDRNIYSIRGIALKLAQVAQALAATRADEWDNT